MALDLYMVGMIVQDMGKSLEFYRRLGLAIPEGSAEKTHVEVKMGSGLTFFLDSRPSRWDSSFMRKDISERIEESGSYPFVLEFYLEQRAAVEAKHKELMDFGYQSYRAPYATSFGMCFAMIKDPDGNVILLSGDLEANQATQGE